MNERDRNRAVIVLDLLGEEATEENIEAWLASGAPNTAQEAKRVAKTILRLANSIPTPATKLAIQSAGVDLAHLVLGEEAE